MIILLIERRTGMKICANVQCESKKTHNLLGFFPQQTQFALKFVQNDSAVFTVVVLVDVCVFLQSSFLRECCK